MLVKPMNKLDLEETEILEAFENDNLRSVKNRLRELARHRKAAEATFAKDSNIEPSLRSHTALKEISRNPK
jgi:hypothetical protein